MTTTLVLPSHVSVQIDRATRHFVETAGVLIADIVETARGDFRILVQDVIWVAKDAYRVRDRDRLSIASHGYVPALGEAEKRGATALWFHTHPGDDGVPLPSRCDLEVDREISDLFRLRTESPFYGTVIASPRPKGMVFSGKIQRDEEASIKIDRVWLVGDQLLMVPAFDSPVAALLPMFDRNIRAFGPDIQRVLGDLRVGIVGCGGTGSAVAEQLVRLGIRDLVLIDPDRLSLSNVTRVYGSNPSRTGDLKVSVLIEHLCLIASDLKYVTLNSMINLENTARALVDCDIVFGCTDDNAGRLVLSRFATYLMTPVFDLGVLLSSDEDGQLTGIDGRITILGPGAACLVCRGRVDMARAAAELLTPEERNARANEGYAPALAGVEPAVVAFTTAVAAAAVNEFLERLIGYGVQPRPTEVLLRLHEREISINIAQPRRGHYCDPEAKMLGRANQLPFLGQAWPNT